MARWRQAVELRMTDEEIGTLASIARSRGEAARRVERAQILLTYRENPSFFAVGQRLGGPSSDGPALCGAGDGLWPALFPLTAHGSASGGQCAAPWKTLTSNIVRWPCSQPDLMLLHRLQILPEAVTVGPPPQDRPKQPKFSCDLARVFDVAVGWAPEIVVNGGTRSDGVEAQNLMAFNGEVLFSGANASNNVSLWVSNGTTAGTHEIAINGAYVTGVHPTELTVFNNEVLFNGIDTAGIYGLWVYNGQSASEITGIKEAFDGGPGGGLHPLDMTVFNHEVLFNGRDSHGFAGLWVTDGTGAGTHEITVNGAAWNGVSPSNLTDLNQHEVLFSGVDAAGIQGLWVTDGTTAGTHEMTDISGASPNGLVPTGLTLLPSGVQKSEPLRDSPNLALLGQYMASTFAMPSDGHGEKVIRHRRFGDGSGALGPHKDRVNGEISMHRQKVRPDRNFSSLRYLTGGRDCAWAEMLSAQRLFGSKPAVIRALASGLLYLSHPMLAARVSPSLRVMRRLRGPAPTKCELSTPPHT
jgi:ELWxxDGT repeat protein